jgi:DNA-binding XRE family transcriptional regulator
MLYNRSNLIKRLQETETELLTEKELLALATPYINNIAQVIYSIKNAIAKGYTGEYTINYISGITGISRQTFYRWENDGIIQRKGNRLNICYLYNTMLLVEKRQVKI